ncbi:uncharacterized protein LOC6545459 [Drosophila erecta]|uniref:uncharacterized protein LOC6545459 n=1 Tax=Drosophila erecta TaxID=7220 RepID=UPI000177FFE3|nr:uncharacterized protein LOC6545459 [Drosophila erecta]
MCDPCRFLRRCMSCHGVCCPRPSCCERSCSLNMRNCRVVFPGEYQKFSDMVTPSFLLKSPKSPKKRKRSKSCSACEDRCKDMCSNIDTCAEGCEEGNGNNQQNPEDCEPNDVARTGAYGPGMQSFPGTGFGFQPGQPTIIPCYGTYGPTGNAMIFGIPPPTQYGNFGVPGPMVLPVAQPTSVGQGDPRCAPAAGLPTQYANRFNPCTGEVYQCGDQQMPIRRPPGTGQVPANNQFIQGTGMGFATNNQYNPYNVAQGTFQPHPIDQRPVTQNSSSAGKSPAYSSKNQATHCEPNNRTYTNNAPQSRSQVRSGVPRAEVVSQQSQFTYSRPVPQLQPQLATGPRSKSLNQRSPSRGDHSGRAPNQANNSPENVQVSPRAQRSKSLNHRSESREGRSGKPNAGRTPSSPHHSKNGGERNINSRSMPKSMASAGEVRARDNRSHDSRNRNKSVGAPSNRPPVPYGQQNVGMGIDPSNQYYPYNDCAPLNATFVQDFNAFHGQPAQDVNRPQSARAPHLSKEGPKKDRNSNKVPSSSKAANEKSIKCYCTRFDPNNQYYPYYISEESDCSLGENARSGKKQTQEKTCSELLSRITESCPPCDLQKWCHLLMPKDKGKKSKPPAKKSIKTNDSRAKSKMSEHSGKQIEDTRTYPETSAHESPVEDDADCPNCNCKKPCPSPPTKPEMRSCSCSANLPEENEPPPAAAPAPAAVNTGCMPCSNQCPWSWYYNPCTGCYYYCANCCNGCRNCCNYCCSPGGRCCSNSAAAQLEKIPPKPKQKEKPPTTSTSTRNSGGATVTPGSCEPPPSFAPWHLPTQTISTMPGYCPTASPHFSSPYSGRWEAGGVDIHRNNHRNSQGPCRINCVRHV